MSSNTTQEFTQYHQYHHIPPLEAVVAVLLQSNGIGYKGDLPWREDGLSEDLKHFQAITTSRDPLVFRTPSMFKQQPPTLSQSPSSSSSLTCGNTTTTLTTLTTTTTTTTTTTSDSSDLTTTTTTPPPPPTPHKLNAVIMGRKTWESIPAKFKPLSNRVSIVMTSSSSFESCSHTRFVKNIDELFALLSINEFHRVFVAGGSTIYKILLPYTHVIHYTNIVESITTSTSSTNTNTIQVDTYFPIRLLPSLNGYTSIPLQGGGGGGSGSGGVFIQVMMTTDGNDEPTRRRMKPTRREDRIQYYEFLTFERRHEEFQYLDILRDLIVYSGSSIRSERTGVGTISKFGYQLRFSLRNHTFPLLTTKRVFWKGVAKELLWFISGDTNARTLSSQDVHIWDGNASRQYLDSIGLTHREEMDLGPVYGFQWRHWGAHYETMHTNYSQKGIDQLKKCVDTIRHNPTNRRIILSAWNVSDLPQMALPPCHLLCQFWVDTDTQELSCQMYQRSCDMGLGVPFNIASYALLTCMMAQVCGLKPGDFVHCCGDCHVYSNHIEPLKVQLERNPKHFPKLYLNPNVKEMDDFKFEDFVLKDYEPHPTIKMEMAV
ncbi:hypothetical protein FDP41_003502 [Naegleria fowleri]|uniref:Bifunctional dihydrofolate reductase-thymidylate synthase n=1 Tax=Naegleria fowleri TaxID=5763 RepID=A0A6A5BUU2_NAEFO|nr:uncharacterized protein FDP41_003502 [Naegleria fowleri]KAF0977510.1 hypothetical protein FDP41_003502 [Naegleria fowleri]